MPYADGLTQVEDPDGKMLDLDGFAKIMGKYAHRISEAMKNMMMT